MLLLFLPFNFLLKLFKYFYEAISPVNSAEAPDTYSPLLPVLPSELLLVLFFSLSLLLYRIYRTKVDVTGSWSEWKIARANHASRPLTETEVEDHTSNATIYIEVKTGIEEGQEVLEKEVKEIT